MPDIEAQIHDPEHQSASDANSKRPQPGDIEAAQPTTATTNPQTTDPTDPRSPNTVDARPRATSTNDRPHRNAPASQTAGNPDLQRGEKYSDSSDGVWLMYLTEAEKQDKDVTERWKGDTEGILFFTGLFSATVAAFIVESYKKLSPDPTDTTNAILRQLSVQLVNISNGIPLPSIPTQSSQPFKPTTSAVRVNVLWFLSLVLSLTCALSATLMQQWARRYQELAQHHSDGAPHRRARMRAYIFHGINKFEMARAVATMPALLHISVFFFFAGLIDFLFPINTTVSYVILGWVVAFALAYAMLTVLPNLYLNCPYATPLSGFTWRLSHLSVIVALRATLGIEDLFHNSMKLWRRVNQHAYATELGVRRWREALKNQVKVHRQWLSDGLRKSIERDAKGAPPTVVASALEWTLTALDEDKEIETFAAGVPGFFDSRTVPDATSAILPLMSGKPPTDAILGSRLYDLLKTCVSGTSPLNIKERKSRLRVCLKCLCYFARAYNQSGVSQPLPSYFPRTLASPEIIRWIQTEQDLNIRVMGRCFGALVVAKLATGLKSSTGSNGQINDEQLACLSAILGIKSHIVRRCLMIPGAVQLASMVSIALDDVPPLVANVVPSDVLDVVQQTLNILSQALPAVKTIELLPDWPNAQISILGGKFDHIIVSRLPDLLQMCISSPSPLTDNVRRSCLRMCLKGLWYCAKAYHQLGTSKPLPPYFPRVLSTLEIRHIHWEGDRTSRVIRYCFEALVVLKLAADFNSGTAHVGDQALAARLSAIFGTERRTVELWLRQPGAIGHMVLFYLAFSEVGSTDTWTDDRGQSDVRDVVQQTFSILSQTLPAGLNTRPWPDWTGDLAREHRGEFTTILRHRLGDLLKMCTIGTAPLTNEARTKCLKSLWYYGIACHHLRASESLSAWAFIPIHTMPEIARRIHTEDDPVARVIGRCFGSLVANKLAANPDYGHREVACLSAILGTRKEIDWLLWPGAVQLVNMVSLTFGDVGSFVADTVPSDVLYIVGQTIRTLAQALSAELKVQLRIDQAGDLTNVPDNSIKSIIVSHLRDLLKTCTLWVLPLPEEVRTGCLQMCLNGLWCWGILHHRLGASLPLPPEFLDLAGLEITHHIRTEKDQASRVMGRCIEALVINNLAARIKSRAGSTVQISDEELACLSAILGTESRDVILWLSQPGVIELVNIVFLAFGDVGPLTADTVPSYVLDMVPRTFSILSQALPSEINTEIDLDQIHTPADTPDGTAPIMGEIYQSHSIRCLKSLWHCVRAYNQPGNSVALPSYVLIAFASPAITRRIRTERDVVARVIGRCVEALVVMRLVTGVRSSTDSNVRLGNRALARLSDVLGTKSRNLKHWLGRPGAVELASMVSLILDEIDSLFSDTVPSDVLDMIQQTFSILCRALPAELNAEPMEFTDGTSPLTESIYESSGRVCLKNLWHCARAYNQLGISVPLPSFGRVSLTSSEITRRIHAESDPVARVTGRCFVALIVDKLVNDFKSPVSFRIGVYNAGVTYISSILDTEPRELLRWPRPSAVIKLQNVVSLVSGEVETLFTSGTMPADVLHVVQQTLDIICSELVRGGAFARGDLPMEQVLLLREICSRMANAPLADQTLDQLQQVLKQLPPVKYKMRRRTSSIFDPQLEDEVT